MNDFTVFLDRHVSIPLHVGILDQLEEMTVKTKSGKFKICWQDDRLVVIYRRQARYPIDRNGDTLVRDLTPGSPITYRMVPA